MVKYKSMVVVKGGKTREGLADKVTDFLAQEGELIDGLPSPHIGNLISLPNGEETSLVNDYSVYLVRDSIVACVNTLNDYKCKKGRIQHLSQKRLRIRIYSNITPVKGIVERIKAISPEDIAIISF